MPYWVAYALLIPNNHPKTYALRPVVKFNPFEFPIARRRYGHKSHGFAWNSTRGPLPQSHVHTIPQPGPAGLVGVGGVQIHRSQRLVQVVAPVIVRVAVAGGGLRLPEYVELAGSAGAGMEGHVLGWEVEPALAAIRFGRVGEAEENRLADFFEGVLVELADGKKGFLVEVEATVGNGVRLEVICKSMVCQSSLIYIRRRKEV